ncbi:MAG: UxaA family hydrolase, partial [Dongiaceae bacterium]
MAEVLDRPATLRLNPSDPVVVAMRDIAVGETVSPKVRAAEPITRGHKVAILPVATGEPVRKFGQIIGNATAAIQPGQHVHVHNLAFRPSAADHTIGADRRNTAPLPEAQAATFQGILRPDGTVATRNYVGVLTTVNCSATVARLISEQFRGSQVLADFPNVDGIVA